MAINLPRLPGIGGVTRLPSLSPAFLASAAAHFALLVVLSHRYAAHSLTPEGELVARRGLPGSSSRLIELSEVTLDLAPSEIALKKNALPKKTKVPARIAEDSRTTTPNSATLGNSSAGADSGTVGDPNGIAVSIRERYLYELKLFFDQRKRYPAAARELGHTGTAEVAFVVNQDGSIAEVSLAKPSPHERLNRAALDLIRNAGSFKPLPKEIGLITWNLTVPIRYELD